MKKVQNKRTNIGMRKEYDFAHGVIGKYAARYAGGTNIIVLDRELARIFRDSKAVNDALRHLVLAGLADSRSRKPRPRTLKKADG
jgi:hypothetical protein